jgi:hypothetical protein
MLIARFVRLPAGQRRLLIEAAWELVRASAVTRLRPFRSGVRPPELPGDARGGADQAEACAWSVRAVAARAPFRAKCLQQAVALQRMLRRRGLPGRLHYGIANAPLLEAHAWVTLDGRMLIGGEEARRFQEVASWP